MSACKSITELCDEVTPNSPVGSLCQLETHHLKFYALANTYIQIYKYAYAYMCLYK